jgi:PAS domain S-box-containing protein
MSDRIRHSSTPGKTAQRRAEVQYAVSGVLSRASSVDEALEALLPALAEALGWDCAAVWVVGSDRRHLECAQCWSQRDPKFADFVRVTRELHFAPGEGLPGRVWASGNAVGLRDVVRDNNFPRAAIAEAAGLHGGLAFPVRKATDVIAVIECFTRRAERADDGLLQLTEALGHQIGQFLQRRDAETLLEENEQRYAAIVNGALDAIVAIDNDGFVTEFNPAAERLFGYTRAEVLGKEMAEIIIPPSYRDAHRAGIRRQRESGESNILERRLELLARRRGGEEFPVELTISRIPGRGPSAFIGFLRDITQPKRHEKEREAILASERSARDEAVTANRLKDEFLAALSHELRTPLNAVLGWTQMLESDVLPGERRREALATIRRNAEVQKQVVDDMLDVSAFIAGRVRIAVEELPLAEPIEAACKAIQPGADAKHLTVRVTLPDVQVRADRNRLQQVFWNLLANAVKFTPDGGRIDVTAIVQDNVVEIGVRDTGRGIDPAFLPFVLDRFRQAPSTLIQGGLGLGLAIVRQIVEAHGGTVQVHSGGNGCGSEFTVRLPTRSV